MYSTMYEKAPSGVRKIRSVPCGLSPLKIHFSDYPKSLFSRINEDYVFFNKISLWQYFIEKNIIFIYYRLFCCNLTCYCVGIVSVTIDNIGKFHSE